MLITTGENRNPILNRYTQLRPTDLMRVHGIAGPGRHGLPGTAENKYLLRVPATGAYSHGIALDSGRDWDLHHQDILLTFDMRVKDDSLDVGDEASGHTIQVNGVAQTTTYPGGSGTNQWVVRVPLLLKAADELTYSYSAATGSTVEVLSSAEIRPAANLPVFNALTRRIRFTLRKADDSLVVTEAIKLAVHQYDGGDVGNASWMQPIYRALVTTDDAGMVDFPYPEAEAPGTTVYLALFRPSSSPTESLIWTDTIK